MQLPDFLITPRILIEDPEITQLDGYVYGIIYWCAKMKNERCTLSNETFAEILHTQPRSIRRCISKLVDKGYIVSGTTEGQMRELIPCVYFVRTKSPIVSYQGGEDLAVLGGGLSGPPNNNIEKENKPQGYGGKKEKKSDSLGSTYVHSRSLPQSSDYRPKVSHSNKMAPLDPIALWKIADKLSVSLKDVGDTHNSVLRTISEGNKYKVKNIYMATLKWAERGVRLGQIPTLTEEGRMMLDMDNPTEKLKMMEDILNGK